MIHHPSEAGKPLPHLALERRETQQQVLQLVTQPSRGSCSLRVDDEADHAADVFVRSGPNAVSAS
jgi:hypothetical protein